MSGIGLTCAAVIVVIPSVRLAADEFEPLETVLTGLGATYGTVLALVLTLSIIPVQRAGEAWSASILRLYRRDPGTYITFVWLGVCCVGSFLLAVRGVVNSPASFVLAMCFLFLGVSLDVLRWYHDHVCRLLDPEYAVAVELKKAKSRVDRLNRLVRQSARIGSWKPFREKKPSISRELLESTLYLRVPKYPDAIVGPIDDLAEMARKAIARGERPLARAAIGSIAELTNHYLSGRRDNLTVHAQIDLGIFASRSDADLVTNETYDRLREISRAAVNASDEATAIHVSSAFKSMALHTAMLAAPAFGRDTAPLSKAPLMHAFDCVKFAQSKGLDEVGLRSAWILSEIAVDVPKNIAMADIFIPLIEGLHGIAIAFYRACNSALVKTVTKRQLLILNMAGFGNGTYFLEVAKELLDRIEFQVPLAIRDEEATGYSSGVSPLGHAYSPAETSSLGWVFRRDLAGLYVLEDEAAYRGAYARILQFLEILSDHLCTVAANNEFGGSVLVREIDHMIKQIGIAIVEFLDEPAPLDQGNDEALISGFTRFPAFYSEAFRDKQTIDNRRVVRCFDSLTYIGLRFLSIDRPIVLRHCVWCMESIIGSLWESIRPQDYSTLGDVLSLLWGVREVTATQDQADIVHDLNRALGKPSNLTDDQWQQARKVIARRRDQLLERLGQPDRQPRRENAETLIRKLLCPETMDNG